MKKEDLKKIIDTKAPTSERNPILISKNMISPNFSSITDYLDSVIEQNHVSFRAVERVISMYKLGKTNKVLEGHYGSVLWRIDRYGNPLAANVLYFNDFGKIIYKDNIINYLYPWYCYDYYIDNNTLFGEHLIYNNRKKIVLVQDELTAMLGAIAMPKYTWIALGIDIDLSSVVVNKLFGRNAIFFANDFNIDHSKKIAGDKLYVCDTFVNQDINQYLIDYIHTNGIP